VAKNNQNQDEIVVQGDFSDELIELIITNWPHVRRRRKKKKDKSAIVTQYK
jgi:hypothetical protein